MDRTELNNADALLLWDASRGGAGLEVAAWVFGLARAVAAESGGVTEAVLEEHFDPVMAEALQSIAARTAELSLGSAHGVGRRA